MSELQTWWAIPILTGGYSLVDIDPEVECGDIAFNRCSDVEADKAKDKAEIAKLKEMIRKAVPIVSKVSGIEAHTLWKELREAAK